MEFPKKARDTLAATFYDKKVAVLKKQEIFDDEGGIVKSGEVVKHEFWGNVRFTTFETNQSELGLIERGDVQITCATDTAVGVNDLLQYAGVKYVVVSVLPYASHKTIVGERWQKQ